MVNKDAVGMTGTPFDLDVERGKIHELARAIKSTDPAYTGAEPIAPPTFLTTAFHWEQAVEGANPIVHVGFDLRRTMHAEQEYEFFGPPPRAGARLRCVSKIDEIYQKEGRRGGTMTFVVISTEYRDQAGTLVARAKMTGVETGKAPEDKR